MHQAKCILPTQQSTFSFYLVKSFLTLHQFYRLYLYKKLQYSIATPFRSISEALFSPNSEGLFFSLLHLFTTPFRSSLSGFPTGNFHSGSSICNASSIINGSVCNDSIVNDSELCSNVCPSASIVVGAIIKELYLPPPPMAKRGGSDGGGGGAMDLDTGGLNGGEARAKG